MQTLAMLDWLVISLYFLLLVAIVWWSQRRQDTTADYFLAGRNVGWFAIGGSLFASNIGSEHIVGLAGQGATSGMAMAHYELHAWIMVLLAWVFVPFYYRTGVYTVPEFLEKRFGPTSRWILSLVSLLAYVFTKVSVTVYAGALVFQTLLPDTFGSPENAFWIGAFLTVILTGVYTVFGGLRAVLYTDTAQAVILLVGAAAIMGIGLEKLGGWGELRATVAAQADRFALWRPANDPDFPWLGILIGSPIVGIWYWCTDQYIVQRTLAARDLRTARRGALWGGVLKTTPVLIFLIPGLIGYALHQKGVIHIPIDPKTGQMMGDRVFPTLVTSLLPVGLRGLVVAGLLAALMSSLSSLFNSSASLFTVDIYEKIRPGRSERHLVRVGRVATVAVVLAGMAWIPVMAQISGGGLYYYLQSVQAYLAPPITAVFLLGLFWRRMNSQGAVWGLALGIGMGLAKTIVQAIYGAGKVEDPAILAWIGDFNFLYFAAVLFVVTVVIIVVASMLGAPPPREKIDGLTYGSASVAGTEKGWGATEILLSCAVLGIVLAMYLYFSFWLG
ncbi:MAG: sodium:solute symporter [Phycisphaeraceae bacterium]|nr:sodium:solute symporter [Phycisphaeraceae bacterium]